MSIFIRDVGQGAPVVLIHGLGASHRAFDDFISLHAAQYRLLAVDLPEVGGSGPWAPRAPAAIAQALAQHLASRNVERYHLVGHSFGGLVALSLAAQNAATIDSLIVANAPALGLSTEAKTLLNHPLFDSTTAWLSKQNVPVPPALVQGYLQWLWGRHTPLTDSVVRLSVENARHPRFLKGLFESLREIANYRVDLGKLKAASFAKRVVWGERDRLVSVIEGERLAIALGAELQVIPEVGHCLPEEHPLALGRALA